MKKFITIILLIFANTNINSQTILERLDSPDYIIRIDALIEIRDNNLTEYTDALLERAFEQPLLSLSFQFVEVLFSLEYPEISEIVYQFINICDEGWIENTVDYKARATNILIELNDFSTVDYIFEFIDQDRYNNSPLFMKTLKKIALNLPQYSEIIKDLFLNINNGSQFSQDRRRALEYLIQLYGANSFREEMHYSIINDPDPTVRAYAMNQYFFADRKDLLRQQIENDNHWRLRIDYTVFLLEEYGEPADLKFIIDYQLTEPDERASLGIVNRVRAFIPPRPTVPTSEMITNLVSYTDELNQYGWIISKYAYLELLLDIEKAYSNEDVELLCEELIEFLDFIEAWHNTPLLTEEGYKFMHYHGTYIKENVEDEFGVLCDN